jgi:uracil-DNA glycosylase
MDGLLKEIAGCTICAASLDHTPRPVVSAHQHSEILIIGQAPGTRVHESGIPWDDKSGDNLRSWLGIDKTTFYHPKLVALLPMGFCYPGKGPSGDLPPRPECAPQWHHKLLTSMRKVKLTLLVGGYAQKYYLQGDAKKTLTETVRNFEDYLPEFFPLPHPSPRNNIWQAKNRWFAELTLPRLKQEIKNIMGA